MSISSDRCSTQFDSKTACANLRRLISFTRASMAFFTPMHSGYVLFNLMKKPNFFRQYSCLQHLKSIITIMWPLALVLVLLNCHIVASASIINTLPGFSGNLPFKLETGYVGVGDLDDVQLFYYFIESERSPKEDPLLLWLTGGPGCSAFSDLVYEIGLRARQSIYRTSVYNSRIKFAHRMALISDTLYECIQKIFFAQILEPKCSTTSPIPKRFRWDQSFDGENKFAVLRYSTEPWCRNYNYLFSFIWANDKTVQNALNIREGTIKDWERCNQSLSSTYAHDVSTSIGYYRNLTKKNLRALVYSGDHDMVVPYVGTEEWIKSLNLSVDYQWRPWFVNGQVAGYTNAYTRKAYSLTFVTVKGAGHTAPEYKPVECLAMIDRWLAYYYV